MFTAARVERVARIAVPDADGLVRLDRALNQALNRAPVQVFDPASDHEPGLVNSRVVGNQ